jgi:uncharacterized damage-inducible protein DinB
MRAGDMRTLFDFMYWVNHRLLDHAAEISPERFTEATTLTTRDLRGTLVHELDVEWSWRLNLQGRLDEDEADLDPANYPDVASLAEHWARDEAEMRAWLDGLDDDRLAGEVVSRLTGDRGPLWRFLLHIVMHATQQQADAATLLTLAGSSPGELGFLDYLDERDAPG